MSDKLEFSFDGMPVGYFEELEYPRIAGRYRYMPYRGPGHYYMFQATSAGSARCSFAQSGARYEFVVVPSHEHGVLEIKSIESVDQS